MTCAENIRNRPRRGPPLDESTGYWCVICQRLLPNDDGVVVHDAVPHPDEMTFDEEERPQ